jgi:iron-sulfur cluster assembly accessory protein
MIKRLFSTIPKYPINITNNAWNKMEKIMNKQQFYSFLFSAQSGGCNGFNYELQLLNKEDYNKLNQSKIKPTIIYNHSNHKYINTKVVIDPMSEMLLVGTTIDYISEDYNKGILENKFIFIPDKHIATSCGCGVSFNPK